MGTNESSSVSCQVVILMVTLCHLPFPPPVVLFSKLSLKKRLAGMHLMC